MFYAARKLLKQTSVNGKLIEDSAFYFEKAVCSEIEYSTDTDYIHFEGKNYTTISMTGDRVGKEYYLLFLAGETKPTYVFEASDWVLGPDIEKLLK